jgi:hypothetical protein
VKDSGPPGCLRHVHVTARALPCPASWKRQWAVPAPPAGGRTTPPRPAAQRDGRDGADGRALGIAAAGVSGKAKTARPWLTAPGVGRAGEAPFRRTPQRRNRFTRNIGRHQPATLCPGRAPRRSAVTS